MMQLEKYVQTQRWHTLQPSF